MSYPDEPEHDDRADAAGRSARAARPAWDAATYGRPDDTRRARRPPATSRPSEPHREPESFREPEPYREPESYREPEPYRAVEPYPAGESAFAGEAYRSELSIKLDEPADPAAPSREHEFDIDAPDPADSYDPANSYGQDPHTPDPYRVDDSAGSVESYPGGIPSGEDPAHQAAGAGRTGRNLPAAVGVGVALGAVVIASLFVWRPAFLAVIIGAVGVAIWELVRAIRASGAYPPLVPLIAGGALMAALAWWGRADALTFGLVVTVLAVMVWRLADGVDGYGRDVSAAALVAVYLPFLAGFAALLATPSDGDLRVVVTLAGVVLSDTGGYIAGVLFGRHPMARSVSPKKSWEGLAGSLVAASIGGALLMHFLFDVAPWWGAVFGVAVASASVVGDLGESMLKRDLGVKDMSTLLPGHGGLMDRLDSILFAVPTGYVLLVLLAPPP